MKYPSHLIVLIGVIALFAAGLFRQYPLMFHSISARIIALVQ